MQKKSKPPAVPSTKKVSYGKTLIPVIILIIIVSIPILLIKTQYSDLDSGSRLSELVSVSASQSSNDQSDTGSSGEESQDGWQTSFWGNDIDLIQPILPIRTDKPMDIWPDQYGFDVTKNRLDIYFNREKNDQSLHGITVFIDPGHGGKDWGAIYPRTATPDYKESMMVLSISEKLKTELESLGARVILTRTDDTFVRLFHRSAIVGREILRMFLAKADALSPASDVIRNYLEEMEKTIQANNDTNPEDIFFGTGVNRSLKNIFDIQSAYTDCLFISLHINSCDTPDTLHGTRVYYATNHSIYTEESVMEHDRIQPAYRMYDDQQRRILSELIYGDIVAKFPELQYIYPGQGVAAGNYSVIREQNLVSALVELGYINHQRDRQILGDQDNQTDLAAAIAHAVYRYYSSNTGLE